jgi:hypothetical protein
LRCQRSRRLSTAGMPDALGTLIDVLVIVYVSVSCWPIGSGVDSELPLLPRRSSSSQLRERVQITPRTVDHRSLGTVVPRSGLGPWLKLICASIRRQGSYVYKPRKFFGLFPPVNLRQLAGNSQYCRLFARRSRQKYRYAHSPCATSGLTARPICTQNFARKTSEIARSKRRRAESRRATAGSR